MRGTHEDLRWVRLAGDDPIGALSWLADQLRWEDRLSELECGLELAA